MVLNERKNAKMERKKNLAPRKENYSSGGGGDLTWLSLSSREGSTTRGAMPTLRVAVGSYAESGGSSAVGKRGTAEKGSPSRKLTAGGRGRSSGRSVG
jgi:hypothetical protein